MELPPVVVALEMVFNGLPGVKEVCFGTADGSMAGFLFCHGDEICFFWMKGLNYWFGGTHSHLYAGQKNFT